MRERVLKHEDEKRIVINAKVKRKRNKREL